MNTAFALLARFESPTVKLEDICEEYFGMARDKAYQKAALNELPVPTFRASDSQKAPRLVHVDDLAVWLDNQAAQGLIAPYKQADHLESIAQIVAASQPGRGPVGVYFLIQGVEVVYVGQSIDILRRIHQHKILRKFDRYAVISVPDKQKRVELEAAYIRALKPAWNKR